MNPTSNDQHSNSSGFDLDRPKGMETEALPQKESNAGGFDPLVDRGAAYAHAAIDKAAHIIKLKDARDCIKDHPFKSLGVAAGVGLVVGKLLA